jgi:hypothetical protein
MDVSGQFHASAALSSVKEPPIPIEQETGWALEPACTLFNTEKSLAVAGNRTPAVYPVARHHYSY